MTSKSIENHASVRRLRRFFSPLIIQGPGSILHLPDHESKHLHKSLRLKPGDRCLVTDREGTEAQGLIEAFESERARIYIETVTNRASEAEGGGESPEIHLYVAMPQRGKMNEIVEKAQELGVSHLVPLLTDHTAFKIPEARRTGVLERWKKISQEAAKQSGASRLLQIASIHTWREALSLISPGEPALLCHPEDSAESLAQWCSRQSDAPKGQGPLRKIHLWIGPEGGISRREIREAVDGGAELVHLGRKILKVDTAVIAAVAYLRLSLGPGGGFSKGAVE